MSKCLNIIDRSFEKYKNLFPDLIKTHLNNFIYNDSYIILHVITCWIYLVKMFKWKTIIEQFNGYNIEQDKKNLSLIIFWFVLLVNS